MKESKNKMFERILSKIIPKEDKEKLLKEYEELLDSCEFKMDMIESSQFKFYSANYETRESIYNSIDAIEIIFNNTYRKYKKMGGKKYFKLRERIPLLKENEFIHKCSRCNKKHIYTKEDIKEATIEGYYTRRILWHYSEPQKYEQDVDVVICPTCGKKDII